MALRDEYDVSTEALLLRVAKLSEKPTTMFAASRSTRKSRFAATDRLLARNPGMDRFISAGASRSRSVGRVPMYGRRLHGAWR